MVAGRMMLKRGKGKAGFATIQDQSGALQIYVRKDSVGESAFDVWKKTSLGDIVWIKGRFMRTNTGESAVRISAAKRRAFPKRPTRTSCFCWQFLLRKALGPTCTLAHPRSPASTGLPMRFPPAVVLAFVPLLVSNNNRKV